MFIDYLCIYKHHATFSMSIWAGGATACVFWHCVKAISTGLISQLNDLVNDPDLMSEL